MTTFSIADTARRAGRATVRAAQAAFASLLLIGVGALAQSQAPDVDPPDRAARLSDVSGQVWLYSPDANEWIGVARNRPITGGDRIATDNGARAEIALGTTTLRLDAASELEVVQLDDTRFVVQLHKGSAAVRVRSAAAAAEFELDTEEGRFRAQTVGRYRFDRLEQASDLTVLSGQAVFEGRNSALPLTTGQHAQFWLDAGGAPQYTMVQPVRDAFAAWVDDRDRAEDRVAAVRFVSPEMTGAEDLDRYGQWEQTPDYGPIWTPSVVATGWAPYSAGHWAFVRPWGWTWVDDAPWGFAPFHYGRWVHHRDRWGWAPGTYVARPVYAPALVAWVGGTRTSLSLSVGGGGPPVGWFPLAPREVYVPSYRSSPRYVRNININHVTNVTQITTIVNNRNGEGDRRDFANRRFPGAVTVVPASVLTGRQEVGPSAAQFRNSPQARELIAEGRPGGAFTRAPVAAPAALVRPPEGRGTPRPPFEGRPPGNFAGRGDPGRPDSGRLDGGRSDGGRAPGRNEGGRPDGARADGGRPEGRTEGGRLEGGRPENSRSGDRQNVPGAPSLAGVAPPPSLAGPTTPPGLAGGPAARPAPAVGTQPAPSRRELSGAPQPIAPVAPITVPRPSIGGQDPNAIGRPPRGGIAREPAAVDAPNPPQRMLPPSPRLRGEAQAGEGRPGGRPSAPAPSAHPRAEPSRGAEPMRGVEPQRVAPVQPIQPVQRAAEPKAPEPSRAAEPSRPQEGQRPSQGEQRGNRGEQQRSREERQNDRREQTDKR